jgi:hypothetical protein
MIIESRGFPQPVIHSTGWHSTLTFDMKEPLHELCVYLQSSFFHVIYILCDDCEILSHLNYMYQGKKGINSAFSWWLSNKNGKFALTHAMKAYRWSRVIVMFSLNLGNRWRWLFCLMPRLLYPRGKRPHYPFNRRLGGSEHFIKEADLLTLLAFEPRFIQPIPYLLQWLCYPGSADHQEYW